MSSRRRFLKAATAGGLALAARPVAALADWDPEWEPSWEPGITTSTSTLVGASTPGAVPWTELVSRAGSLDAHRVYWDDVPTNFNWAAGDYGRCTTVGSIWPKGLAESTFTSRLTQMLRDVRTGHKLWLIVWHEPEDDGVSPSTYIRWQVLARRVINEVNRSRSVPIKLMGNFMAWSTNPDSHRNVANYRPPSGTWNALGWDGYDKRFVQTGESISAAGIFDRAFALGRSWGLPPAIIETGTPAGNRNRPEWIRNSISYARSKAAVAFCYYNRDHKDGRWQLDTDADYKALGS